ncbi:tripartite motif-containing protein 45-like [Gigantopelta aegis]|uniref:tripartite motif-containing protein 45-like n=1 Tax=Gigantopelta aegis TaxID=1735272 RepID=UPI001B88B0BA|nr:tripartite motif-containing protein 45-like [Gigantopelta aegis]
MATNVGDSTETCGICLNTFNHPKLLPCFHTFCCECLQEFVSKASVNNRFYCPVCRYEVALPEGGVTKFQTNFYVEARAVKHAHNRDVTCDVCEQKATHVCHECELALCETCVKNHKFIPVTKSHLLIQLGDVLEDKPFVVRDAYCVKHSSEKLRFYCRLCDKAICLFCKLTAHEGHNTEDICDVVATARSSLVETKKKLEKYLPEIKESMDKINTDHANALLAYDDVSVQINTFADHLVERINKIRTKAVETLKEVRQRSNKQFAGASELMQSHKEFLNRQTEHITDQLKHGLDCDVLRADREMKDRLIEVQNMDLSVTITHNGCRRRLPVSSPHDYLDGIGCDINDVVTSLLKQVNEYHVEANVLSRFSCGNGKIGPSVSRS